MNPVLVSGIDLVEISRFRSLNPAIRARFFVRVFTQEERAFIGERLERAAGLFAAKEALAKALGCGIGPVSWQELEISHSTEGQPQARLYGAAEKAAARLGITQWSLSISHTREHAVAMAIGY